MSSHRSTRRTAAVHIATVREDKKRPAVDTCHQSHEESCEATPRAATTLMDPSMKRLKSSAGNSMPHIKPKVAISVGAVASGSGRGNGRNNTIQAGNTEGFTQNGTRKRSKRNGSKDQAIESISDASLDTCAAVLASLDQRSHARSVLIDANAVLDHVVFPMSFPWTHRIKPVAKSIPPDIDEMFGIRSAGNEILDHCTFGKFAQMDKLDRSRPGNEYLAARRSEDPGVVELTSTFLHTMAQDGGIAALYLQEDRVADPAVAGELPLRAFEECQDKSRRRLATITSKQKTVSISFRVGSTSSRSSIFSDYDLAAGQSILRLEAQLPVSVQEGSSQATGSNVVPLLGSYDCGYNRHGEVNGKKCKSGRTRLIWCASEEAGGNGSSGRSSYRSLLTGRHLESGAHKRPRRILVSLRVNGSVLSSEEPDVTANLSVDDQIVESALENAISGVKGKGGSSNRQCYLDRTAYVAGIIQEQTTGDSLAEILQTFAVHLSTKMSIRLPVVTVSPPKVDCLLSEDGQIITTCTSRGIICTSVAPGDVRLARSTTKSSPGNGHAGGDVTTNQTKALCSFLDTVASDNNMCSVCWSNGCQESGQGTTSVIKCKGCSVPIHRECYGKPITDANWKCDACNDCDAKCSCDASDAASRREHYSQHRWNLRCEMCQQLGGTMIEQEDGSFIHEVCRIWGASSLRDNVFCALCDKNTRPVIQCMAHSCEVMFHPICALVVSSAAAWKRQHEEIQQPNRTALDVAISNDEFRCTQFRLAKLVVAASGTGDNVTLPVGYCGIHNPDRRPNFYGLYPGGRLLQGPMRVPPRPDDIADA